jgi:hypothetical protein
MVMGADDVVVPITTPECSSGLFNDSTRWASWPFGQGQAQRTNAVPHKQKNRAPLDHGE